MFNLEATQFKAYLESATTRELIKMADQAGIDIPPDLERVFIIRELLDMALDETPVTESFSEKQKNPANLGSPLDMKTAALPEQYHITYLDVLPRDPQWVYVFWEIKAMERERHEMDPRFEGYALKVLENKKPNAGSTENHADNGFRESFTVPVGKEDKSWYLSFPEAGTFRVALWVRGLNISLIISRPFVLPRFLNSPENEELFTRPLIKLSGVADLTILKAADRTPATVHE